MVTALTVTSNMAGSKLGWWAVAPFQFAVCIGCVIANHVVAGQAMKVRNLLHPSGADLQFAIGLHLYFASWHKGEGAGGR